MEKKELDGKRLAKEMDDYKTGQRAANLYWAGLIVMPIMLVGFNPIAYSITAILIVLSFHIKTRKVAYFLATIPIPIYAFFIGGWVGFLAGFIPALIMAFVCAANYMHYQQNKELEQA